MCPPRGPLALKSAKEKQRKNKKLLKNEGFANMNPDRKNLQTYVKEDIRTTATNIELTRFSMRM